jgi:uncharacterized protein DUF3806
MTAETKIGPLFESDVAALGAAWGRIEDLLREQQGADMAALERSPAAIEKLHGLLESGRVTTADLGLLQDMGVVLGFILNSVEPRLVWVVVEDEDGRTLGLHYRESAVILFPLTMLSKRVERGEALSLRGIFDGILAQLEVIGKDEA